MSHDFDFSKNCIKIALHYLCRLGKWLFYMLKIFAKLLFIVRGYAKNPRKENQQ